MKPSHHAAQPGPNLELQLGDRPDAERLVRDVTAAFGGWMGFAPERVEDLQTAVCEAFLNAVEHGNAGVPDDPVRVVFQAEPGQLAVIVTDVGRGHLPDVPPLPGQPDRRRGWGLYFMRELTDRVDWRKLPDGRNEVRLIMRLAAASAGVG